LEQIHLIENTESTLLYFIDKCETTQLKLVELIEGMSNFQNEVVGLYTFNQTNGIGQSDSIWKQEPFKNCALSVAIPIADVQDLIQLNKHLTLTILGIIQRYSNEPLTIKWPNDIVQDGQKVAGLLMQIFSIKKQKFLFLGIGVNVNQDKFPDDLKHACSLKQINNSEVSTEKLTHDLFFHVSQNAKPLYSLKLDTYFDNALWRFQEETELEIFKSKESVTMKAKIIGVDDSGRLRVEIQGIIMKFHHGEVKIKYKSP
jgi:BirA family biotin operon repressor/biotin-[acetyl-CoA-carboxylase] ligase